MPNYTVAITEIVEYLVPVRASNEDAAQLTAQRKLSLAKDRDKWLVAIRASECEGVNLETPSKPTK